MPNQSEISQSTGAPASTAHDGLADKLGREAELIGLGMIAPIKAIQDHPVETGVNLAISTGIGVGLGLLSRNPELGAAAFARSAGIVLGLCAIPMLAFNGLKVGSALKDNWDSSGNWDSNVRTMQDGLGTLELNAAFMVAGGLGTRSVLGRQYAAKPFSFLDISKEEPSVESYRPRMNEPIGRLYQKSLDTVVRITGTETRDGIPAAFDTGSGSIVSADGKVMTAFHVIGDKAFEPGNAERNMYSNLQINFSDGRSMPAKFIAGTPELDIALLQAMPEQATTFKYFPLAEDVATGSPVVAIGYPQMKPELFLNQGHVTSVDPYYTESTAASIAGMSGGPVTNYEGAQQSIVSNGPLWEDMHANPNFQGPSLTALKAVLAAAPDAASASFEPVFVPPA